MWLFVLCAHNDTGNTQLFYTWLLTHHPTFISMLQSVASLTLKLLIPFCCRLLATLLALDCFCLTISPEDKQGGIASRSRDMILLLYSALMRPPPKYCVQVWTHQYKIHTDIQERAQQRDTGAEAPHI